MSELHVLFKVADAEYVLPASEVLFMEAWTGATRVPGAAPHVAGLVQLRGRVLPVVDLRVRFGLPSGERPGARVVVVRHGERTVGLLADSAREVIGLDASALQPPPEVVLHQASGMVRAVVQLDSRLLFLPDVAKVIGEEMADGV